MGFSEEEKHFIGCPVLAGFTLCKCPTLKELEDEAAEARWDAIREETC